MNRQMCRHIVEAVNAIMCGGGANEGASPQSVSPLWPHIFPADVQSTSWKHRKEVLWPSTQNRRCKIEELHKSSAGGVV